MTSLSSRLRWWYVLAIVATMVLALFIGRWLLENQLVRSIDLLNAVEFQEIHDRVVIKGVQLPESELLKVIAAHAERDSPLYFFQVRRAEGGEVLFRSANMHSSSIESAPDGRTSWTCSAGPLGEVRVSTFGLEQYQIQIGTSLRNVRHMSASYLKMSFVVIGIVTVLSVFVGYWGSRVALDPIRRIRQTAAHISAENLSERIPVGKARDEVSELAQLLNSMFDRLEESFSKLGRFAADVSHELRTPLSLIRLQSERLLMRGQLSEAQTEAVHQQLEAIARLDSVIGKLLFLAKAGSGSLKPNLRRQGTPEVVAAFAEDASVLCEEQGVTFRVQENAAVIAAFDAALLRQVLLNLVINALKATPRGGEIRLSSTTDGKTWRVAVEDTGPGVPEGQLQRIFEPFVRTQSPDETENIGGSGLGLTICSNIIDLHDGRVYAENCHPASGLRVVFEIPLTP